MYTSIHDTHIFMCISMYIYLCVHTNVGLSIATQETPENINVLHAREAGGRLRGAAPSKN